jgi:hypothetical protein
MGKTKGKIKDPGPKSPMVSYKNASGVKVDIAFDQPLTAELGIAINTRVSFDIVMVNNVEIAVAVSPINNGTVGEIDPTTGLGSVLETESQIKYPFQQNYTAESGIIQGSIVKYTLVWSNNVLYAAALSLIP